MYWCVLLLTLLTYFTLLVCMGQLENLAPKTSSKNIKKKIKKYVFTKHPSAVSPINLSVLYITADDKPMNTPSLFQYIDLQILVSFY